MEKITAKQLFVGILLAAFLLRFPHFFISLAYDEIWTISNFIQLPAGKLLFDLSLPNNHPLNSILIKLMYALPLDVEFIRLPSLLAGMISVVLAGYLAKRMAGRSAALWSMFFMALNAPLIVYSMQARGYSLQIMFLLIFACSLLKVVDNHLAEKRCTAAITAAILSAAASVMTLSTSVLYLAGITLLLWNYYSWKALPRKAVLTAAAAAMLCGVYLLLNFSDLNSARKWGDAINSIPEYFKWLWSIFYAIVPLTLLPFAVYYLAKFRRYIGGYLLFLGLIFISAIFTNGGPGRVYLPLCVLFCIVSGAGAAVIQEKFAEIRHRQLFMLAAVALAAAGYFYQIKSWRFCDYLGFFVQMKNLPQGVLVVYPAGDSYSVIWNSKGKAADFYTANFIQKNELHEMLVLNSPGYINGADKYYNEKTLPAPFKKTVERIAGLPVQRLSLKRVADETVDNHQPLIAVFSTANKKIFKMYEKTIFMLSENPAEVLHLNCWFSRHGENYAEKIYCGSWYIAPGAMSQTSLRNIQEFATLYYLQD